MSQKLVDNIKSGRSCNYSDVKLILDNEQTCVEPLHRLNKVVDDARKRFIYFFGRTSVEKTQIDHKSQLIRMRA